MLAFLKVAGLLVALYLAVAGVVAIFQGKLLFPEWMAGPRASLPGTAQRLVLDMGSDAQLVGVHLPPQGPSPEGASLVLGFGGNAWNAADLAHHLHALFPDRDVVAFHYRGYAPSTGRPTARALLDDALEIHDAVVARLAPGRIVAVGISIGSGPAAHLAGRARSPGWFWSPRSTHSRRWPVTTIPGCRSASCCGTAWTWSRTSPRSRCPLR